MMTVATHHSPRRARWYPGSAMALLALSMFLFLLGGPMIDLQGFGGMSGAAHAQGSLGANGKDSGVGNDTGRGNGKAGVSAAGDRSNGSGDVRSAAQGRDGGPNPSSSSPGQHQAEDDLAGKLGALKSARDAGLETPAGESRSRVERIGDYVDAVERSAGLAAEAEAVRHRIAELRERLLSEDERAGLQSALAGSPTPEDKAAIEARLSAADTAAQNLAENQSRLGDLEARLSLAAAEEAEALSQAADKPVTDDVISRVNDILGIKGSSSSR